MNKTGIEWCDLTFNPVTGCSKVSAGCAHCYAERYSKRKLGSFADGRPFSQVRCHPDRLDEPLTRRKPAKIFVCSMSDLFHEDVPFEFVVEVFRAMASATQHDYFVLTKRPARMREFFAWCAAKVGLPQMPAPPIWLGVSVENQKTADERIPILLDTPAAHRFVSVEPMLGPVDVSRFLRSYLVDRDGSRHYNDEPGIGNIGGTWVLRPLSWVICGGETGPGARPMHEKWARDLRDQCKAAGVSFFFKKMGGGWPTPVDLQVREWPEGLEVAGGEGLAA